MVKQFALSFFLGVIIPGMLFGTVSYNRCEDKPKPNLQTQMLTSTPQITVILPPKREPEPVYIPVLEHDGAVTQMPLEEYVLGVVLGEMPASFELEALKAQAVAARTYALRCSYDGVHEENAVCKDHGCCQNYCDPDRYGGGAKYLENAYQAVKQTEGVVMTYDGRLIFAVYFASSGGMTEDAVAVWGRDFPYLKPVSSPGEQDQKYQDNVVMLTAEAFQQKLGGKIDGDPVSWIGTTIKSPGGGVDIVYIGGIPYSGVKLRKLLGLRSTMFAIEIMDQQIWITTNGYGHRVGMSQYGAQAMAKNGSDYVSILKHYYQGISLTQYPFSDD